MSHPMAIFSLGVLGAPRRTMLNATPYLQANWKSLRGAVAAHRSSSAPCSTSSSSS